MEQGVRNFRYNLTWDSGLGPDSGTRQGFSTMFQPATIQAPHLARAAYNALRDFQSVFGIGALIIGTIFAYHFLFVRRNQGAPPLVSSWIPFFGSAFSFLWNPERFVLQCRERYGNIYSVYMVGKRLHVVCDPVVGIPSIYKRDKIFCVSAVNDAFGSRHLGRSEKSTNDTEYHQNSRALFVPLLLAQDKVDVLVTEFNKNLQPILVREIEKLQRLGCFGGNGTGVEMDIWIQRVMFECSGKTLFGKTWPDDEQFFNDWKMWDDAMYSLLKGYPRIFTRKAVSARERYYARLLQMFKQPLVSPSDLTVERMKVFPVCRPDFSLTVNLDIRSRNR